MNWKELLGKRIYTKLNSGRIYSGIVLEIEFLGNIDDQPCHLISIKDKFDKFVSFSTREIAEIREE